MPPGSVVYAIGDIHGRIDLLDTLLDQIAYDARGAFESCRPTLVFMGDYIDRGPDSKAVVARLLSLDRDSFDSVCLRGNHDQTLLDFLADPASYPTWRDYGGNATLLSYGVEPPARDDRDALITLRDTLAVRLPPAHLQFFEDLKFSYAVGDYFFAHAGVRPGVALSQQTRQDLLWIRDEFLSSDSEFGKIVVHGHTPELKPVVRWNRIGIDTKAYASGCLTALVLEGDERRFLAASDR